MKGKGQFLFHVLAFLTMALWGVTFVSTKILINSGLTPAQIFTIRFAIAYSGLWIICFAKGGENRRLTSDNKKHELVFLILGITGGSMYFLTENSALAHTQACNVSFIVCMAPLLTTILTLIIRKVCSNSFSDKLENVRIGLPLILGTVLALGGMAMVIFDGVSLSLSPKGDILAFLAALCWAVYSQFMSQMSERYGTFMATRKVFFYGLLTIVPVLVLSDNSNLSEVSWGDLPIWGNLLFLAIMASLVCFLVWNRVMAAIGNVTSTNYVYLNPVFTLIGAIIILGESMTLKSGLGSAMILAGVIISGGRIGLKKKKI